MAAHSYWGIRVSPRAGSGNGVSLAEIEMRSSVGGTNLCVGGTAIGTATAGTSAAKTFDGNASTLWYNGATGGNEVLIGYNFASAVEPVELYVLLAGAATAYPGSTFGPANTRLVYSDDGVVWSNTRVGVATAGLGSGDSVTAAMTDAAPEAKFSGGPFSIAGSAPPPTNYKTGPQTPFSLRDTIDGGTGIIVGTVKEKATPSNLPLRRKVRLFHEFSGRFVRETWSNDAGDYVFTGIDRTQRYTVVSYDYLNNYRAVIADNILPEAM